MTYAGLSPAAVSAAKESFGGMRLLRRADFNAGAHINSLWRMPCRGALDSGSKKALTWDNKHITWFGEKSRLGLLQRVTAANGILFNAEPYFHSCCKSHPVQKKVL